MKRKFTNIHIKSSFFYKTSFLNTYVADSWKEIQRLENVSTKINMYWPAF